MARIAFILLCHKDPEAIIAQARRLTAMGDYVSIHFDGRASDKAYTEITETLADNEGVAFAKDRVKCGWGEWSLVRATLNALETATEAFPRATHFYMLSGDCMPTKSAGFAHTFLDQRDVDYIESYDFFRSDWIKTGMKEDRLHYRHLVNERNNKTLFYGLLKLQRKLGLSRNVPADLEMMIGSQWWCLRRTTVEAVLDFCKTRKDVMRFFSTTWIPDETFFQTIVRHLVPRDEIDTRTLTFLMFTDYGMPATFYNDHYDLLLSQDFLFARKISPEALDLKQRLGDLWESDQKEFPISGDGRRLFSFLTQRGRVGRRFAPRFWENEASLGRDRELLVLVCKKWHVAKRLSRRASEVTGVPTYQFVFDEGGSDLPNLGGIESTLAKRNRHRRAMMRMVYQQQGSDRMIICLDPANFAVLEDFYADSARIRTLELACDFDDDYLRGHAQRVGLAGDKTPQDTLDRLLPTLRYDFAYEAERLRSAEFPDVYRVNQSDGPEAWETVMKDFFSVGDDDARLLAQTPHLFHD